MKRLKTNDLVIDFLKGDLKDSYQIAKIEEEYFRPSWSENVIKDELSNKNSVCFVCKAEKEIIGYVFFRYLFEEGEILRICVKSEYRKKKIASELFRLILSFAFDNKVSKIFLEVRKSNFKAIGLYEKFGFMSYAERKGYYSDNGEDALLMQRQIEI